MTIAMAHLNDHTAAGAHLNEAVATDPRRSQQAFRLVLHLSDNFVAIPPRTILGWWESINWLERAGLNRSSLPSESGGEQKISAVNHGRHGELARRLLILAAFAEASHDANLAEIVYRRIIQLDPDAHIASNNLAMLLLDDQGNLQEALDLVSKALKAMPNNMDYLDTRQLVLDAMATIQQPGLSSK